jgi:precorrin-6Y C5,15-methyltransferase (decarboxylating)
VAYERIVNAFQTETAKPVNDNKTDIPNAPDTAGRNIILCGCGMGTESCLTADVKEAIINADAVFGSKRMLELANKCRTIPQYADMLNSDNHETTPYVSGETAEKSVIKQYEKYLAKDIIPILEDNTDIRNAVILFSGDSGFYSGAGAACREFSEWDGNAQIRILPGISSVSYLASKLGETYDDAALLSLHGRHVEESIHKLLETIRYNRKTFLLLSGSNDIKIIGEWFDVFDIDCVIYAGSNLSYADETIDILKPDEAGDYNRNGIITALILNEGCERSPVYRAFNDDDFIRDKVPMTKECIRHESILRLGLKHGDVVYDIGGGTGSVAIEIAAQDPSIRVYTFERKEEAAGLIERNINSCFTPNVQLIQGEAPEALKDIEAPDCVFIGGSSGRLDEIIGYLSDLKSGIRYVANAVSLETTEELRRITDKYQAADVNMVQISVSNVEAAGSHHLLKAQNPVTIFSFVI